MHSNTHIVVWDKARGPGGRTRQQAEVLINDPTCTADLGAQYITATPYCSSKHQSFYEELLAHSILKPLTAPVEGMVMKEDGCCNFITPRGISYIVKHYLGESVKSIKGMQQLKVLKVVQFVFPLGISFGSLLFDASVWKKDNTVSLHVFKFTPVLQLHLQQRTQRQMQKLEAVSYSSRYALGLFYEAGTKIDGPWAAKYITNNPCICFISINNKRHNLESTDAGPAVVIHTSMPFGLENLEGKEKVEPLILEELPGLPKPVSTECQKWRYSQVINSADMEHRIWNGMVSAKLGLLLGANG
ncbi:Renalase [Acipenser ruthenus]|uniref:Renalase n=1 Tax=Acipenser ruthenus TaxID=7906 RepID=A0A444UHL7_ACIRT|nr:Renalase [Acipenser ruthenus]